MSPELLPPALYTQDIVVQRDTAAAVIFDPIERAELHGKEVRSDMAAFKAANPEATLQDFVSWREDLLGLSTNPFPQEWLQRIWSDVVPKPASKQAFKLFEPEGEAEMALHYLENIEGTQLLLQLFRVLLRATLEELSQYVAENGGGPAQLRVLRDRAAAAALSAFAASDSSTLASQDGAAEGEEVEVDAVPMMVGEVANFPAEDLLESAISSIEAFEAGARLASSLRAKLPGDCESLLEELLLVSEASAVSPAHRKALEQLFARSRAIRKTVEGMEDGDEPDADEDVFEALPLAKEFVLVHQPAPEAPKTKLSACGPKRIYAEVRERHFRLALAQSLRIA